MATDPNQPTPNPSERLRAALGGMRRTQEAVKAEAERLAHERERPAETDEEER